MGCDVDDRFGPQEVTEFPTVLLKSVVDEFRVYVQPARNPALTPFCTRPQGRTVVCSK